MSRDRVAGAAIIHGKTLEKHRRVIGEAQALPNSSATRYSALRDLA
jgi:hypothetical protein